MKTGAAILLLALVHRTVAFYPYVPSWMCSGTDCTITKRSEGLEHGSESGLEESSVIPTLRLRKLKSKLVKHEDSVLENAYRKIFKKSGEEEGMQLEARDVVLSKDPTQSKSAAIDQDGIDYSYFAQVDFGSNDTPLYMLLDTGATSTWVPTTSCQSLSCLNPTHRTYGPANSSTYETTSKSFSLAYGTGSVSGSYATDTVSLAGLNISLTFGAANVTSDDFNNFPFDGILGLGYSTSTDDVTTFMGTIGEKKLLKANLFGVDLSRAKDGTDDGEINFGAPDTSKYNGSLVYTPVASGSSTWSIAVDGAGYNGKSVAFEDKTALIDTGTTWIFLPPADASQLFDLIDVAAIDSSNSTYLVPCNTTKAIHFTFSGVSFDISSEDWVGGVVDSETNSCASNIYPTDLIGDGQWLIGDTFLKNVYTVFDLDQSRIGFGAKTSATTDSKSTSSTASSSPSETPTPSESPLIPAEASQTATSSTSSTTSTTSTNASETSSSATHIEIKITIPLLFGLSLLLL